MGSKEKLGLWSIVLLGINGVVGSGVYLLPGKAYALMGPSSLWGYVLDTLLVLAIALCFAETGGMFDKTGGPYLYAKEAFGDFVGFEVGIMKWAISIIAWATMAVGFATALSVFWPSAATGTLKNVIAISIIVVLSIVNYFGVSITKYLNNIVTVAKLLPLILFVIIGVFFIKGSNFVATPEINTAANLGPALILIFYAFTGFESLAVAAGDMENPKKNVPIALMITMILASVIYILTQAVAIGTLGTSLAKSTAPVADSAKAFLGEFGVILVTLGTLISIGGINVAASFNTPRAGVALAEGGILPMVIAKKSKYGTPYIAIIITALLAIPLVLTGGFVKLAMISVISRFAQYIPTSLAVIVLRKREDLPSTFRIPFGPTIPIVAVVVSLWLLTKATSEQIIWGLGGLVIGVPLYFILKYTVKRGSNNLTT